MTTDRLDRLGKESAAVLVDPGDELLDRQLGVGDVGKLGLEPGQPVGKLLRRGQRLEVDGCHRGELPLQLVDGAVERRPIGGDLLLGGVLCGRGALRRFGAARRLDVDVVLVADPLHDPHAPVPRLARFELTGVDLIAEPAGGGAGAGRGVGGGHSGSPDPLLAGHEGAERGLRMFGGPRRLRQEAPGPEDIELGGVEPVTDRVMPGEDREACRPALRDLRGPCGSVVLRPVEPLPARGELDPQAVDLLVE